MCGVAGDKYAALAVLLDNLVLNPEAREPRHIADIRIGLSAAAHDLAETLRRRFRRIFRARD